MTKPLPFLERWSGESTDELLAYEDTPEHAPSVESALNTIGCKRTAKLAQRAVAALGVDTPVTADAIEEAMGSDPHRRLPPRVR